MAQLVLTRAVMEQIRATVGTLPPECGGVLGAGADGIVTEFLFDAGGEGTPSGYTPDVAAINRVLVNDWMPRGILMVGIVHSHANGVEAPSCMDVGYGVRILQALDTVERFYLPIVTVVDGVFRMACFVVEKDPDRQFVCRKMDYRILDE